MRQRIAQSKSQQGLVRRRIAQSASKGPIR